MSVHVRKLLLKWSFLVTYLSMRYFIKRKLYCAIIMLWSVVTLTFCLMHCVPGSPFDEDIALPKEVVHSIRGYYQLDEPLYVQYGQYWKNFFTGHWGRSLKYEGRFTRDIIQRAFPVSLYLGGFAFTLALLWGMMWGALGALYHNRSLDRLSLFVTLCGMGMPNFLAAVLYQYLFCVHWNLLPIAQWGSFKHTILPALSLAGFPAAYISRLFRNNLLEVRKQGYILTAKMKGLSTFQVFFSHMLKNSVVPLLPYLGVLLAHITTGSLIIEKIYGVPGLGYWFFLSVTHRDYPLILGLTLFYSVILICINLTIDIVCAYLDPRIRTRILHENSPLLSS